MTRYPIWTVVDIETAPVSDEEALRFAPEFYAPSNYKDPLKIEAAKKEAQKEWLEQNALRATTGRICAIGWMDESGSSRIYCKGPEWEAEMIGVLWSYMFTSEDARTFVTFFGNKFDWRFLIQRSWALGLDIPYWLLDPRGFLSSRCVDLAKIWSCGDLKESISLDRLGRYLGVGSKEMSGKRFYDLFLLNPEAAEAYLSHDLNMTMMSALRMGVIKQQV